MPTVPVERNSVGIADVTGAKLQPADLSGTGLEAVGRGFQQLGQGLQLAHEAAQHNLDIFNEGAVRQADNQLADQSRTITLTGPDAFYKKTGADAYGSAQATQEALTKARTAIAAGLKNDTQRRMFAEIADRRLEPEFDGIAKHADSQLAVYNSDQSKSRLSLASDNAVTYSDDPKRFGDEMARVASEVGFQTKGMAPEVQADMLHQTTSSILTRVVDAKMTTDPVGAAAYAHDHDADLTSDDRMKIAKALHDPLMERQAYADVQGLMASSAGAAGTNPAPATPVPTPGGGTTLGRMTAITLHTESRGQDYTNGHLTTSSAGAQGAMQTMPGTQRNPGFGIKPAQDDSVAEMNRVGRDYLAAMMQRYHGDAAKAWAAYNGGPGRLDAAVAAHGAGWLAGMPRETQDYVHTNMAALGGDASTGSSGSTFAPRRDDLNGIYARIDAQADWSFDRKQAARAQADKMVARDDHLLARQQDDAKDAGYRAIDALGPSGFTSISQLPAEVRRNASPEVMHSWMDQAEQNAKPKAIPENGSVAITLKVLAARDPEAFKNMDLRPYQPLLNPGEFASLAVDQAKERQKPPAQSALASIRSEIDSTIRIYGGAVGLDVKANSHPEDLAQYGRVTDLMRSYLERATDGGKRRPTDDEMKAAFDSATMQVIVPGGGWFGGNATKRRYDLAPGDAIGVQVPADVRSRIVQVYRKNGVDPTDDMIGDAYLRGKGQPGLWK